MAGIHAHLVDALHARDGDGRLAEGGEQVLGGETSGDRCQLLVQRRHVGDAAGIRLIGRIGQAFETGQGQKALPLDVVAQRDVHEAIRGWEHAHRSEELVSVAPARHGSAEGAGHGDRLCEPGRGGVDHGHVDAGPFAGECPLVQRLHQLTVGVLAGAHVGQRDAHHLRVAARLAGEVHETPARLQNRIVGGLVAVRPEPGDAQPDEVGLDRAQGLVVHPQRRVVLGQLVRGKDVHIEFHDHAFQELLRTRILQIEGHRLLAAVDRKEITAHAVFALDEGMTDHAVRIAEFGVLEADNPHAVLRQTIGEIREHRRLLETQHGEVGEDVRRRAGGHTMPSVSGSMAGRKTCPWTSPGLSCAAPWARTSARIGYAPERCRCGRARRPSRTG